MAGISSKAMGKLENRKKFNGIEHTTDLDLNQYDAFYRTLDPQIGRFWQIDPEADNLESYSPYESMGNNPISNVDPLGDFKTRFGAWLHKVFHGGGSVKQNDFGEWFVYKNKTTVSADGTPTVTGTPYYGKGRNQYSSAGEQRLMEDQLVADGLFYRASSQQEANDNNLRAFVGVLLPNVIKGVTGSVNIVKPEISNISKIINAGKQGKHIVGHNNYQAGKSILTEKAQGLLDAFHAGNVKSIQTINDVKTRVDFGKVIGTYINPQTNQAVSTTRGIIVNSKSGVHIIPSAPY